MQNKFTCNIVASLIVDVKRCSLYRRSLPSIYWKHVQTKTRYTVKCAVYIDCKHCIRPYNDDWLVRARFICFHLTSEWLNAATRKFLDFRLISRNWHPVHFTSDALGRISFGYHLFSISYLYSKKKNDDISCRKEREVSNFFFSSERKGNK